MEYIVESPKNEDIIKLNKIRTDEDNYRQLLSLSSESIIETEKYFFDDSNNKENIILRCENEVVGYCQLRRDKEKRRNHKATISIAIDSIFHNKGCGNILLKNIISIAKNQLSLRKISLTVLENNVKAIALYKKNGFKIEGLLLNDTIVDGELKNVYIMGLLL
ncbi:GNAT family N-acetyltransferase [Helcococcus kunzii]|uniref:GNAT family N-acetyltransferase n=1 Tax=Helcococcus kunzii TaxID=40091 RepID=UPI0021A6E995|nr:GNAT family N-acetyltransferase [Helcococcus kunzii]MCT1796072.1 GNAT family N-acetyltransferase [Helcococcus kunzii]MCT1989767.1 GNAT family N-acetyltransferase [Helcococcus kunzii]